MVNILVPTDLSDLSKVAVQYAVKIVNKLGGTLTLLHVVSLTQPTRASMRLQLISLEKELMETANEDLEDFVKEISAKHTLNQQIKYKVVSGASFSDTVIKEAKRLGTGLIVMGTRGARGLRKYVLGTHTASVIEASHIPVLAVPELGDFHSFETVVYATDLNDVEHELEILGPYLKEFNSKVHLLHVTPSLKEVASLEKKVNASISKTGLENVVAKVIVNKDIDEAIDYYITESKADLLAMFTHDLTFYERLFNRSVTRQMAFHNKVPLLAFRQS